MVCIVFKKPSNKGEHGGLKHSVNLSKLTLINSWFIFKLQMLKESIQMALIDCQAKQAKGVAL